MDRDTAVGINGLSKVFGEITADDLTFTVVGRKRTPRNASGTIWE